MTGADMSHARAWEDHRSKRRKLSLLEEVAETQTESQRRYVKASAEEHTLTPQVSSLRDAVNSLTLLYGAEQSLGMRIVQSSQIDVLSSVPAWRANSRSGVPCCN